MSPKDAAEALIRLTPHACDQINHFARETLTVRGGRIGSGMGTLLEALWGYYVNRQFDADKSGKWPYEIAWLADHEYNDFAVVQRDSEWDPARRVGELLRVEAKSMNNQADESKGHFDELEQNLGQWDVLLVLVWRWEQLAKGRSSPQIVDHFVGSAIPLARLRDALHEARGGTFVDRNKCPDGCAPASCLHHGEPLNASGKRERLSGPESLRPSAKVSFAANFGGMVRMLKTNSPAARSALRQFRRNDETAHRYVSFIHRNFPTEEQNQYLSSEWKAIAAAHKLNVAGKPSDDIVSAVREGIPNYQDELRALP
ncbi:MAG TPA: hypothetical protein PLE54_07075 [Burkholderiaceae bacterium]|nr:hypothetical protein [Burkholderiaceae bacterium]